MSLGDTIQGVRRLSDDELLAGLRGVLGAGRRIVALVLAHLAEVEQRRLHLLAGFSSLFAYCTLRLGMSEDEAYRRIRVACLARRFPGILELLASGRLSLSVAALLESHLNEANHRALLDAVSGKTVAQAREVLASWFPQPDVLPFIRKLPTRPASAPCLGANGPSAPSPTSDAAERRREADAPSTAGPALEPLEAIDTVGPRPSPSPLPRPSRPSSNIEPLSPERYKVTFTADAKLKRKLDLARDLLRHAVPSGDVATLLGRALDLLLEKTLQRRFGRADPPKAVRPKAVRPKAAQPKVLRARAADATPDTPGASAPSNVAPAPTLTQPTAPSASHLPNATRRAVLERDGLRCTWRAPDGTRCESRAWLEHDHIDPRSQGGSNEADNIRTLCRAHNRLAAEQTYGQAKIGRIIARQRHSAERCDGPRG